MTHPPTQSSPHGAAPADQRPHPPWPLWKKLTAYLALAALAAAAIWYIDRRVHHATWHAPASAPER